MPTPCASPIERLNRHRLLAAVLLTLAASLATADPIDSRTSVLGGDDQSMAAVASTSPTSSEEGPAGRGDDDEADKGDKGDEESSGGHGKGRRSKRGFDFLSDDERVLRA